MEDFIITFGRCGIRNGWVRVTAASEEVARAWAFKEYGSLWSGVYSKAEHFDGNELNFYPLGEFQHVELGYEQEEHV